MSVYSFYMFHQLSILRRQPSAGHPGAGVRVCPAGRDCVDERTLLDMARELKKRQFRNGTVDNIKTTALVIQVY
ncbi:hypothetical protein JTE90_016220 [Oedothorax gibbosus]|uniref:Uncharacterized protein n=2 Tax=Oedothorax gibbosus TaxID=931172 RepID=A0AAV6TL29_9ARAC|nr:hypothetical protein JTE90_016220 [Oedothorax gibbosus]